MPTDRQTFGGKEPPKQLITTIIFMIGQNSECECDIFHSAYQWTYTLDYVDIEWLLSSGYLSTNDSTVLTAVAFSHKNINK